MPVTGEAVGCDDSESELGETTIMPNNETTVEAEIDCNRSRVELTVPEDYRCDVTVAVANLTATTNEVTRSTVGSVEGDETIEFTDEGIVFVFVQDRTDGERIVTTDVANCSAGASELNTTVRPNDGEPAIRIDCVENDVRFTAPEGTEYVAKVVVVAVSPTRSSTRSVTKTLEGNATVTVDEEALVAAFASTGEIGDDRTVSMIRNCSPYGRERISDTESEAENQRDGRENV